MAQNACTKAATRKSMMTNMPAMGSTDFMMGSSRCPVHWKARSSKSKCVPWRRLFSARSVLVWPSASGQCESCAQTARATVLRPTASRGHVRAAHCRAFLLPRSERHLHPANRVVAQATTPWEATQHQSRRLGSSVIGMVFVIQTLITATATASCTKSTRKICMKLDHAYFSSAWTTSFVKIRRSDTAARLLSTVTSMAPFNFRTRTRTSRPRRASGGARGSCQGSPPLCSLRRGVHCQMSSRS
mmetsp:Transcript_33274/g.105345  ORF Transcript_33274/g.105345 Transcript_33274/m.105345 type:complete len:244 (+) Transcript_33274:832-1563(+)